jgi:periplasmic divalent cation tolerance protein
MMPPEIRIVLTSVDDRKAAQTMAKGLVEAKLAACVQVSAGGESWYRWQGEVRHEAEFFLVIKTSAALLESVVAWLQAQHPYELPEVVWFPAEASPGYAAWLQAQMRS